MDIAATTLNLNIMVVFTLIFNIKFHYIYVQIVGWAK